MGLSSHGAVQPVVVTAAQCQLKDAQQMQASSAAFAAILEDRCVVTWGAAEFGGDGSSVQDLLRNV